MIIYIIGVPGEEKEDRKAEKIFKGIMAKQILSLVKHIALHIQGLVQILNKVNPMKCMSKQSTVKLLKSKDKEKFLRSGEK